MGLPFKAHFIPLPPADMKLSVNFPDADDDDHLQRPNDSPTVKLKFPLIFPYQHHPRPAASLSAYATASTTTFSLSTNFPSFPSVSISYTSPTPTVTAPRHPSSVSLALKSGVGLFGSPKNSPLVFSAHLSLFSASGTVSPVFSLRIKPNIGHFSFHRSTSSNPNLGIDFSAREVKGENQSVLGSDSSPKKATIVTKEGSFSDFLQKSNTEKAGNLSPYFIEKKFEEKEGLWSPKASFGKEGSVGAGNSVWEEVQLEPCFGDSNNGILTESMTASRRSQSFSGFAVKARTVLPVTGKVAINVQWGVNLPSKVSRGMPYLSVSKLEIERIEDRNCGIVADSSGGIKDGFGDVDMLKGTWSWMRRDVEFVRKENEEMKRCLEEISLGAGKGSKIGGMNGNEKKDLTSASSGENRVDFEKWRRRRNAGEENRGKGNQVLSSIDLESQLRDAIISASSSLV